MARFLKWAMTYELGVLPDDNPPRARMFPVGAIGSSTDEMQEGTVVRTTEYLKLLGLYEKLIAKHHCSYKVSKRKRKVLRKES